MDLPGQPPPVQGEAKREQIVRAYMQCVLELGLEKASMGEVAARVGLDRSSIHYYFSTRGQLLREMAQLIADTYIDRLKNVIANFAPRDRARQLVEHMFGPDMHQPELAQLIDELALAGNRDQTINQLVAGVYHSLEKLVVEEIDTACPEAPVNCRRVVAYAFLQLSEGCSVFTALGFSGDRLRAAHDIALRLLDKLHAGTPSTGKARRNRRPRA